MIEPVLQQRKLEKAILCLLFERAQTDDPSVAHDFLRHELPFEVSQARVLLAVTRMDDEGLCYSANGWRISQKGYDQVETELEDEKSFISSYLLHGAEWLIANHSVGRIPASDRIVTRQDNLPAVEQIAHDLAAFGVALEQHNELADALGDLREVSQGEVKAAEIIISSSRFNIGRLWLLISPLLKFVAEKFAGASIGELAKRLLAELAKLL